MKAISLLQPWATLAAIGAKRIETRSWKSPYRGPLAIHASKGFPEWARERCFDWRILDALVAEGIHSFRELPLGVIIATCELVACLPIPPNPFKAGFPYRDTIRYVQLPPDEPELSFGDYTPNRWAWVLDNVQRLPAPVPARGALGVWEWNKATP